MALLPLLPGCANWPNFEYEPVVVVEDTTVSDESAQHLGILPPLLQVQGSIDATGLEVTDAYATFGFEEWYAGDEDYFAFNLAQDTGLELLLTWDQDDTDLDLLLFRYNAETRRLDFLAASAVNRSGNEEQITVPGLQASYTWVVLVAGAAGPASDYLLTLDQIPTGEL